jgi:hypothetical protein
VAFGHFENHCIDHDTKTFSSPGLAAEACAIVRFQPVERGVHLRIQSEPGAALNEERALFRILHQAAGLHFIRPGFDFNRCFRRAVGSQPCADVFIIFRGLNGGFELLTGDALETEEHVVERAIIMIFAQRSRQAGAAFVNSAAGDGESGDAFARTMRRFLGQVSRNDWCGHICELMRSGFQGESDLDGHHQSGTLRDGSAASYWGYPHRWVPTECALPVPPKLLSVGGSRAQQSSNHQTAQ